MDIDSPEMFESAFHLAIASRIGAKVFLFGLMLEIQTPDVMSSTFEFCFQRTPERPHHSGN